MSRIIDEQKKITGIYSNDDNNDGFGYSNAYGFEFEAYGEEGMSCFIAFIEVKRDGHLVCRVPAWQVRIVYEMPQ